MDGPNTPLKLSGVPGIYYALSDNAMIIRTSSLFPTKKTREISRGYAQEESKFTWSATEYEGLTWNDEIT